MNPLASPATGIVLPRFPPCNSKEVQTIHIQVYVFYIEKSELPQKYKYILIEKKIVLNIWEKNLDNDWEELNTYAKRKQFYQKVNEQMIKSYITFFFYFPGVFVFYAALSVTSSLKIYYFIILKVINLVNMGFARLK